jgi:hypothetical protein
MSVVTTARVPSEVRRKGPPMVKVMSRIDCREPAAGLVKSPRLLLDPSDGAVLALWAAGQGRHTRIAAPPARFMSLDHTLISAADSSASCPNASVLAVQGTWQSEWTAWWFSTLTPQPPSGVDGASPGRRSGSRQPASKLVARLLQPFRLPIGRLRAGPQPSPGFPQHFSEQSGLPGLPSNDALQLTNLGLQLANVAQEFRDREWVLASPMVVRALWDTVSFQDRLQQARAFLGGLQDGSDDLHGIAALWHAIVTFTPKLAPVWSLRVRMLILLG